MASEMQAGDARDASPLRKAALGLAVTLVALGSGYALAVPVGEAPDEPAHLAYVGYLLLHHALPPLARPPYGDRYESYQAPLDYAVTAVAGTLLGMQSLALSFQPNPAFSFLRQGSRAYLPAPAGSPIAASIRELRLAHLLWAAVTAVLVLMTTHRLSGGRVDLALAATAPFVLSPQFLFVSATVNNDAAVSCLAALALFALMRLLDAERPSPAMAVLAGIAVGLAPFGKVSGFLLLAPLGLAGLVLASRKFYLPTFLLLAVTGSLAALWIGLALWRFGTVFPPPPAGLREGLGASRELLSPHWLGSLWVTFWGKLGWLNLRLPRFAYLFFLAPTALAVGGCFGSAGERTHEKWQRRVMTTALGVNSLLLLVFLVRIDWQPQGRFLFPSLPATAGLTALGLRALAGDTRWGRSVLMALLALLIASALGTALLGIYVLARTYA
jgi:hypothetical protein